ncbi:MAG: MFS transporter [Bacteroidales bacterium]|nr:MFS transporter [Bacteroidales bacterium]
MTHTVSSRSEKNTALLVATVASFLTPFLGAALNVALPSIGEDLEADAILLNLTATVYLLATAAFLLPSGRLGDIVGRKKIFTYGLIIFTLSSVAGAVSVDMTMLITSRIFQGIGSAMIFGTGIAILSSVFPPGERGRALGINVAAVYAGLTAGPFVGGLMTELFGWRSVFWMLVPIGTLSFFLLIFKLHGEWSAAKKERFDWAGALMYMLSLGLFMSGISLLPDIWGYPVMAAGITMFFMFVVVENRIKEPLVEIKLYRFNRVFAFSNLAALINYSATFGVGFLLSLYFQFVKGMTPGEAGAMLVIQPLIMAVISPVTGRLSDRIQPQVLASLGMSFTTLGLFLLGFAKSGTSLNYFFIVLALLGLGFALFSSPNTNAIMSSVESRYYGIASGAVGTMRMIGQMLSMGIVLVLFSVLIGKTEITAGNSEQFIKSMNIAIHIFTALCFFGIFASIARGKMQNQEQ